MIIMKKKNRIYFKKRYPFTCPKCDTKLWAAPSMMMPKNKKELIAMLHKKGDINSVERRQ